MLVGDDNAIFTRISFFFSSRRRHTRYWRDWSSDVCSSDLPQYVLHPHSRVNSGRLAGPDKGIYNGRSVCRCVVATEQIVFSSQSQRPYRILNEIVRSEEHTSELQSRQYLVCRLLLEKKKNKIIHNSHQHI